MDRWVSGERLRAARRRRALTLRELSDITGVGYDTISRIETGQQQPRISTARKLAEALGVEVADLMAEDGELKTAA